MIWAPTKMMATMVVSDILLMIEILHDLMYYNPRNSGGVIHIRTGRVPRRLLYLLQC